MSKKQIKLKYLYINQLSFWFYRISSFNLVALIVVLKLVRFHTKSKSLSLNIAITDIYLIFLTIFLVIKSNKIA